MKAYAKDGDYSYTLGVFPTIELLKNKHDKVFKVVLSTSTSQNRGLPVILKLCEQYHIEIEYNDKTINKLSKKGNCYAIGFYYKYDCVIEEGNHVVLVNPGDMGNIGTIIRTMLGFNYKNLIIIRPGVDINDPKAVRASMGSVFSINYKYYNTFEEYMKDYPDHQIYTLMLKGATNIHQLEMPKGNHSLVFGNESSGLPDEYLNYGKSVFIPHSKYIDSLNLSMALGITLNHFSKDQFKDMSVLEFENA